METGKAAELPEAAGESKSVSGSLNLHSQVAQLLQDRPSQDEFFQRLIRFCRRTFRASVVKLDLETEGRRESLVSHDERMPRNLAERFVTDYLSPFSKEFQSQAEPQARLKRYERADQKMTLVGVPLQLDNHARSTAVLVLMIGGAAKADALLVRLDAIAAVASTVLTTQYANSTGDAQASADQAQQTRTSAADAKDLHPESGDTTAARQTLLQAAQFRDVREFAFNVVNSLRTEVDAEQVFLGIERQQRIVVEAASGVADFKASSPGIALVQQAMDECLDAGESMVYQPNSPSTGPVPAIHRRWSTETSGAAVCSFPLIDGQKTVGVVSLRRSIDRPFSQEQLDRLQQALRPYGPALRIVDQASQPVASRVTQSLRSTAASNLKSGSLGRKILLSVLVVGLLWFCFGSVTYRPICPVKVTATDLRHLSAPLTAKLGAVLVKPGQQVEQSQLLAELDVADLRLEFSSLQRQFVSAGTEIRQALADDDLSRAAVARSQLQVFEARMAALQQQIEDSEIRAPADGTVVLSGLESRIGQTITQGEELMQFAPAGEWRLEIEVPDDIAPLVKSGQTGFFSAAARPAERQAFEIEQVDGAASVVTDRNVFIAHAAIDARPDWMRIGMEGTVQITTEAKPVWWVTLHRVVDWARVNFWL